MNAKVRRIIFTFRHERVIARRQLSRLFALMSLTITAAATQISAQSVPPLINYQGRLANSDGTPYPTADYRLEFAIYDAAVEGRLVWGPQVFDGAASVGHGPRLPVVQGYFNAMLGPVDTAGRPILDAFGSSNCYVQLVVSNRPPIQPRQRILATPFAVQAAKAVQAANGSPPGTIVAYGGTEVPEGWLLCDGSPQYGTNYPRLFAAIRGAWGGGYTNGIKSGDFNLPDLRGLFLRGVNGDRTRFGPLSTNLMDPDTVARTNVVSGGNFGNQVGSVQNHEFGRHTHTVGNLYSTAGPGSFMHILRAVGASSTVPIDDGIAPRGGNETRPANAYVNYIIKY